MGHFDSGDSTLAGISVLMILLSMVGLGAFAAVVGIAAGTVSLIINWPKFKIRMLQIIKSIFK